MLYRRQKTNSTLWSLRFLAHLSWSKVRNWVSQLHLLPNKRLSNKYTLGDCESNSQGWKYRKSLGTWFLIWFYRCWANQNKKNKECQRSIAIENAKRAPVFFYFICNLSFSSFLMNECQNIELDELFFIFYCVVYWTLSFSFYFSL